MDRVRDRRPDWNRLAGAYVWQVPLERPALRALLALLEPGANERLVDIGTGTAALLHELARLPRRPERAVGLDSSPGMLARARRLPTGWELVQGDAESLPFDDASFDVATATYLLHILDARQRTQVLAELCRILRPAGRVGVVTVAPPRTRLGSWLNRPVRAAAKRGGALVGLRPLDPRADLSASGFQVTASRRVRLGYRSLCVVATRI
jgi:ubiquinone/menaquinone biosynthesis C-methylase UbiE